MRPPSTAKGRRQSLSDGKNDLFSLLKRCCKSSHVHLKLNRMATKSTSSSKKTAKRKPSAAFMKPVTPDAKLAAVVGAKPLPRTELTSKLWDYIKKNGLQDKKNKRQINADAALKPVFNGKASVSMFEMTKLVSGHLVK